jgi:PAS domain S-box-containing protein
VGSAADEQMRAAVAGGLLEDSAEDLYDHAPCGYLSTLPSGLVVKVNATFLEWTGHRREDLVGRRRFQDLLSPGGRIYHETHYAPLLRMQGAVREIALDVVCADGRRLPVLVNSVLRRDADGEPVLVRTTVFDATDRRRYERELLLARDRERATRERNERLHAITAALAAPLDAAGVAAAAIDQLVASTGADRATLALLADGDARLEVLHRRGAPPDPPLADVTGEPVFDPTGAALPLRYGGRSLGVLELGFATPRELAEDERAFLVACAAQCAQALERARLYEQERDVAHALQRSLLAGAPPHDERFAVATYYAPGVQTLEVGGDWFDTFAVGSDRIGMVVGDVVGRGLEAATAMGQLRSALRALALAELGPARVLEHLDRFVMPVEAARYATVAYAELELGSGRLRFACAGHMPPVVVEPGAPPRLVWDGRSPALGAYLGGMPPARGESEMTLRPGARLVLYTDGLVERRTRTIDAGLAQLLEEIARRPGASVSELVAELSGALLDPESNDDDVCLLALAYGAPAPAGQPRP